MTSRTGEISVKTNDIFPIIKKWLYSEHDIFLRELVANGCDAISKRQTLSRNQNVELPSPRIDIVVNAQNKTVTISDNGLGMTEAEVEKYIAQLAFSGAEEFVQKMKAEGTTTKGDIIGKFGLGFYSVFMVAEKVEVESLSMNPESVATKWICSGETTYSFEASHKKEVGTTITLHIGDNAESKEFLKAYKVRETLKKHCEFMQYPIFLDDRERAEKNAQEIIDNQKLADGDKNKREMTPYTPEQVNQTDPLWTKDPNSLKDEDYLAFYRSLFPMDQEPLFWIHLNVDHPFHLQGVLYFPKLNPMKPVTERNIRLYCKQVFVSDDVKNIMPEYLGLLKGAVDSTDIPLNVSRSSLQGDPNIKKISNYISKRVAEALKKLFKNDRPKYEKIWEDIQLFVKYGVISDDKFDQVMRNFTLFKNSENKLVTLEEYQSSIPATFREKLKGKVITFEKDKSDQSLKSQLLQEGIHTIETEEFIDPHFTQHVEMKSWSQPNENDGEKAKDKETSSLKFVAIESEMENLLTSTEEVSPDDVKIKDIFQEVLFGKIAKLTKNENDQNNDDNDNDENDFMGKMGKTDIDVKRLTNASSPAYFKLDEQMKRMQAMTRQMGLNRNDFPVKKTLVINPKNSLIQNTLKIWEKGDKELVGKIAHHVQDLAQISSTGLKAEEKEAFVKRSTELIDQLSKLAF